MLGRSLLALLLVAACRRDAPSITEPAIPASGAIPDTPEPGPSHEGSDDGPAALPPGGAGCLDRHTLRREDGEIENCYPYACRAGVCLERCAAVTDCAGAHHPGELATEGWPLECMPSGQCTPMHPDKVR